MNGARMYSLERRLARIESDRGMNGADNWANQMLIELVEPPCANVTEAFLRLLGIISDRTNEKPP